MSRNEAFEDSTKWGLRLGLAMRFAGLDPFESQVIARVGVGADGADPSHVRLGQIVNGMALRTP